MEVYNQPKFDASLVAATCELWIAFIGKLDEYPDYLTKTIKHLIFFCWENRRQNQLTGPIHRQNPTIYRVTFYLHTVAGCFCISETWTLPDYHYILRYDCFRPPGIWCELDEFSPPWNWHIAPENWLEIIGRRSFLLVRCVLLVSGRKTPHKTPTWPWARSTLKTSFTLSHPWKHLPRLALTPLSVTSPPFFWRGVFLGTKKTTVRSYVTTRRLKSLKREVMKIPQITV